MNISSGVFTAPVGGVYSFNLSGLKMNRERDESIAIDLRLNGITVAVTRTSAGIDCGTLSLSAILKLWQNDQVDTVLRHVSKNGVCRDLHCHFTGALLSHD